MAVSLKLTIKLRQKGHMLKNRELVLYINGTRYNDYLAHEERAICLQKAIDVFDDELQTAADNFMKNEFGAYLWLYTPDFIRGEEISGLFRLMYLKEIIRYISQKESIEILLVDVPISENERMFFKTLNIKVNYKYNLILVNRFINFTQSSKEVYKAFKFNLKQLFSKPNVAFAGNLIDTSTRVHKNRYDNLEVVTQIFNNKVKYYSGNQLEVRGCGKNETVVFKRELNASLFLLSLKKSIQISRFIQRNKNTIPAGLYNNHKGFYKFLLFWDLILAQESINKYLKKSNIKSIIQVSTITKPIYRSLITSAKQQSIQFIIVASRSLTKFRNSERLLKCDVEEYNNTALPDWYIFKDNFSKKIFDSYPGLSEKVKVGARFRMKDYKIKKNINKPTALLLLFNHRKDVSYRLLKTASKLSSLDKFDNIIFRCHPSFVFNSKTLEETFSDQFLIDNTGKDYSGLLNYRVITISGPTSAALEAVNYGTIVLWAPFVYDDAVLMDEVMNQIGVKCITKSILEASLTKYLEDVDLYYEQFQKDKKTMKNFFLTNSQISKEVGSICN